MAHLNEIDQLGVDDVENAVAGAFDGNRHLAKSRGERRRSNCRGSAATFAGKKEGARQGVLFRRGLFRGANLSFMVGRRERAGLTQNS